MRKFYEIYPIWSAVPTELSWSHFQELIRVDRKENKNYLETDLEKALLSHLTEFLLELGRGFSFVASQQRLKIGSEYYYFVQIKMKRL